MSAIRCGDIGEGQREIEFEPLTAPPIQVPTPAPVEAPVPEPVPA